MSDYLQQNRPADPVKTFTPPRFLQRASAGNGPTTAKPPIVGDILQSSGRQLDPGARADIEHRFGQDFSQVRVHTDAKAAESARSLNAQAYTVGRDIVFGEGRYAPGSPSGQRLLAHELTHTIQQGQSDQGLPRRISTPGDAGEREAVALSSQAASCGMNPSAAVEAGTLQRQEADPPQQAQKTTPSPQPQPDPQPASDQKKSDDQQAKDAPTVDLKTRVSNWLDQQNLDLPAVADPPNLATGQRRVFSGGQMMTLDAVTDEVSTVLGQKDATVKRPDVWSQVWQYYNQKKADAENKKWQTVVSIQYTPQYTFKSNQPIDNPSQHSFQLSGGKNTRFHEAGASGTELTLQANVSLLNLSAPKSPYLHDVFQNATLSAQLQQVWNLGKDFRLPVTGQWASLQASAFAQVAAGVGTNYSTASGERKVFLGFLAQPSAGGQVNLNIGSFQIILNGSVVYSYLSPTAEKDSKQTSSWAVQGGIGVGGQF